LNANGGTSITNGYAGSRLLECNGSCADGSAVVSAEANTVTSRLTDQALELQKKVNNLEKELEKYRATVAELENNEEELKNRCSFSPRDQFEWHHFMLT
jgi:chromosome segregation ATPase